MLIVQLLHYMNYILSIATTDYNYSYSFDDRISYIVVDGFQTYFTFITSIITLFLFSLIIFYPCYTSLLSYVYFHFLRKSRF